jgi:hypothetical protein
MAWWRRADCPVRPVEQDWIERSLDWLVAEFGTDRLHGDVVLPTDDYFPGAYRGSRDDVRRVLLRLCRHMGVDPAAGELEHLEAGDHADLSGGVPLHRSWSGAAGHYRVRAGLWWRSATSWRRGRWRWWRRSRTSSGTCCCSATAGSPPPGRTRSR